MSEDNTADFAQTTGQEANGSYVEVKVEESDCFEHQGINHDEQAVDSEVITADTTSQQPTNTISGELQQAASCGVITNQRIISPEHEAAIEEKKKHIEEVKRRKFDRKSKNKLFVGGLVSDATDQFLFDNFKSYGKILDACVVYERGTQKSRGFGYVVYGNEQDAEKAIKGADGLRISGKTLCVEFADDPKSASRPHSLPRRYDRHGSPPSYRRPERYSPYPPSQHHRDSYERGRDYRDPYYEPRPGYGPDRGSYGPDRGSYGPDRGSYGPDRGSYGPDRGSYGPDRGSYGPDRGSYGPDRGSYGPDRGSYGPDRGSYGPDRGYEQERSYGQDRYGRDLYFRREAASDPYDDYPPPPRDYYRRSPPRGDYRRSPPRQRSGSYSYRYEEGPSPRREISDLDNARLRVDRERVRERVQYSDEERPGGHYRGGEGGYPRNNARSPDSSNSEEEHRLPKPALTAKPRQVSAFPSAYLS